MALIKFSYFLIIFQKNITICILYTFFCNIFLEQIMKISFFIQVFKEKCYKILKNTFIKFKEKFYEILLKNPLYKSLHVLFYFLYVYTVGI